MVDHIPVGPDDSQPARHSLQRRVEGTVKIVREFYGPFSRMVGQQPGEQYAGMPLEYLGVTPKEFFDVDTANPTKATDLLNAVKGLSNEQLDNLIALARDLKKQ